MCDTELEVPGVPLEEYNRWRQSFMGTNKRDTITIMNDEGNCEGYLNREEEDYFRWVHIYSLLLLEFEGVDWRLELSLDTIFGHVCRPRASFTREIQRCPLQAAPSYHIIISVTVWWSGCLKRTAKGLVAKRRCIFWVKGLKSSGSS